MSIPIYSTPVESLSDAELAALMKEIEDAGFAHLDEGDYDEGDEAAQAYRRFYEMECEVDRRWALANPEEAAKREAHWARLAPIFATQVEATRKRMAAMFEHSSQVDSLMRHGDIAPIARGDFRIPLSRGNR